MKKLSEYDKKSILAEEVFTEIFEQEDEIEKARMLLSFQDRAKELGVKQGFDTMLKAYKKAEQEMNKKRRSRNALSNWTDFTGKYEAMKCGSWLAADDGIRTFNKDYDNEVIVCYHPILPIGRLKNLETGEEQIKLAYKRNHRWTEITVPKDIISSASKIVSLSKLGVSVTSENAKLLVKYLSDVENLNDNDIPLQKSTSKLGWIGGDFIPYDTDILFDGDLQFKQLYESIRQQGSYMEWLNHVCGLRKRDRIRCRVCMCNTQSNVLKDLLQFPSLSSVEIYCVAWFGHFFSGRISFLNASVKYPACLSPWAKSKNTTIIGLSVFDILSSTCLITNLCPPSSTGVNSP